MFKLIGAKKAPYDGDGRDEVIKEFLCDTDADFANLPVCDPGSSAVSIESGTVVTVNTKGKWQEFGAPYVDLKAGLYVDGVMTKSWKELLEDEIIYIKDGALYGNLDDTSVFAGTLHIAEDGSVTAIGGDAFSGCEELTGVIMPDSVTQIGYRAFQDCYALTSIVIPDSVTRIGDSAFSGSGLASITFGTGLKIIEDDAFRECGLVSVELPYGLEELGGAFEGCENLEYVYIPNTVTSICGDELFYDCPKIDNIVIPDSVTEIGEYLFSYCTVAKNLTLGNGITVLPAQTFYECAALECIDIPDSVVTIEGSAIEENINLKTVTIGSGVKHIEYSALYGSPALTEIYFRGTMEQWNAIILEEDWLRCDGAPVTEIICSDGTVSLVAEEA